MWPSATVKVRRQNGVPSSLQQMTPGRPLTVAACPRAALPATRARVATSVAPSVTNVQFAVWTVNFTSGWENLQQLLEPAVAGCGQEGLDHLALLSSRAC